MTSDYNLQLETFAHLPFPFFKILFFRPILFHIIGAEECCMHRYCVLWETSFVLEEQRRSIVV